VRSWAWVVAALVVVTAAAIGVAYALPGDVIIPDGPTSSPAPTLNTSNWHDPAFSFRAGVIIAAALVAMAAIALLARALDKRRGR